MPWKYVGFLICLVILSIFIVFNVKNTCDISFGFYTLKSVPIFLSLLVSFCLGVFTTLPLVLFTKQKKEKVKKEKSPVDTKTASKEKTEEPILKK